MRWKTRKREKERNGGRLVRDCSTRSRLHIWCWPPFDRDKTPNTITPLCREDAKVMGSFPTRGGSEETWNAYLSRFAWSIKSRCRWFESRGHEGKDKEESDLEFSERLRFALRWKFGWWKERKRTIWFRNFVYKKVLRFKRERINAN